MEDKERRKAYLIEYAERNKDKIAARRKRWYEKTREMRLEYGKNYREKNRESLREAGREYFKNNRDKYSSWVDNNIDKRREISRNWEIRNKEKKRAHARVKTAISEGKIFRQPCVICGKMAEAHHKDYSKPLDVIWLCPKHHAEIHRKLRKEVEEGHDTKV